MRNYRGKSLGAWVFGDLVSRKGTMPPYIHFYDSNGCEYLCDIEINTLGECTGEKDINGTAIYTGDIVKRTSGLMGDEYDGFIGIVKFIMAAFVIESLDGNDGTLLGDDVAELEVLGNIYDNPELLNNDTIKVWYQTDGGGKLYEVDIESVACDLQVAREEYEAEATTKILHDESQREYEEILEKIKTLKLDKEIEAYGFRWGCTMISQKELDTLPEFDGW